jgi:enamine deaminase RidA (YjgF/YER057c/UK114 family)
MTEDDVRREIFQATIAVAALPLGVSVEIDVIAAASGAR